MLVCKETGLAILPGQEAFAASRLGDNAYVPLSREFVNGIPEDARTRAPARFKQGHIGIFRARVAGENGDSSLSFVHEEDFLFSVPVSRVKGVLPKTVEDFNFPKPLS